MRTRKAVVAGVLGAAALLFVVASCGGDPTNPGNGGGGGGNGGGTGVVLTVSVIQNISNTATKDVVLNWIPGADDGYGVVDGFRTTATDSVAPVTQKTTYVPEPGRTTTFNFGPWPINTVISGAACVRAERRGLTSGYVCTAWSASVDDANPPVPIIDSVRAVTAASGATGAIAVTAYYRLSPSDGGGAYTMQMSGRDSAGIDRDSVAVAVAAGSATVTLTGYTYGQPYAGQACVTSYRRALFSQACAAFTALVVDKPPPPPIIPVALKIMPKTLRVAAMWPACAADTAKVDANGWPLGVCTTLDSVGLPISAVQQMCAMFLQSDSNYYMLDTQQSLSYCREQYDQLPTGKLPGYPTASVRPYVTLEGFVALRVNTRKEELASIVFESAFPSTFNVFTYAQQRKMLGHQEGVITTPNGLVRG